MTIDSEPGRGTCVRLRLPTTVDALTTAPEAVLRPLPEGLRVLLVDDNPSVLVTVELMLQRLGASVQKCSDPERALARLQQESFDVLLTDVVLHTALDGHALAKRAIYHDPSVIVLLMSGYSNATVDDLPLLLKPFSSEELELKLKTLMATPPPQQRWRAAGRGSAVY